MHNTWQQHKKTIQKIFLLLLLLLTAACTVSHREAFFVRQIYRVSDDTRNEVAIDGNQILEQEFYAKEKEISSISIAFKAWEQKNGSGKIFVELQTADGEVLASAKKSVRKLKQGKTNIYTSFALNADLEKGKTYKIVIQSKDVELKKGCAVYSSVDKGDLFGNLTVNGEPTQGRLKIRFNMTRYSYKKLFSLMLIIVLGILFLFLPFEEENEGNAKKQRFRLPHGTARFLSRMLFAVSPLFAFYLVQCYAGFSISRFLKLLFRLRGALNLCLYYLLWALLYLICNRTKYTSAILVGAASVFGLANYFVWSFRGQPIMFADLMSVNTAMDVAGSYEYTLHASSMQAVVLTVVFLAVVLRLPGYKGLPWKKRLCALAAFCIPFGGFYTQLLHGTFLKDHKIDVSVWAPSRNYAQNGSLLSFFISYTYSKMEKPDNYSTDTIAELAQNYASDIGAGNAPASDVPNVIAIMNEAFSDLTVDGPLELSEDYMPYIRSISENTVKGRLYVSILGGNTANTEFEFLTGCSMAFMPFGSVPYNTTIKNSMPTLTTVLKEQGYAGNDALHPYREGAWNRNRVYPLFGFEHFYPLESFGEVEYVRTFTSDKSDFEFLISKYEELRAQSEAPLYLFNVTVQNHGGYRDTQGLVDTPITITSPEQQNDQAEQYINLAKMTDDAFRDLIEYFSDVEEPTVIVMFGDHQPSLPQDFYDSLFGKSIDEYTLEDIFDQYSVPYVIWANYDIEEETRNMSANYLSAYLTQMIGADLSGYQKYLLDLHEEIPILTAKGYCGSDGVFRELGEKSPYSSLIDEYRIVQYNNIYDSDNRVESFYHTASVDDGQTETESDN